MEETKDERSFPIRKVVEKMIHIRKSYRNYQVTTECGIGVPARFTNKEEGLEVVGNPINSSCKACQRAFNARKEEQGSVAVAIIKSQLPVQQGEVR